MGFDQEARSFREGQRLKFERFDNVELSIFFLRYLLALIELNVTILWEIF